MRGQLSLYILRFITGSFLLLLILAKPAYCEYNLATGEEELIFISSERETKMGESISKQVAKKMKLDKNYSNQEKVAIIGKKLARVSDRKDIIYHFSVIDDDMFNAFALPGGYIYVFKGLLDELESDDELAAILAHEIGHVCAKHSVKRLQNSLGYEILRLLVVRGASDGYSQRKANEAINQLMLTYTRRDEFQADMLAIRYLKRAGYKPEAMVSVLDRLIELQMDGPKLPKRYWHTHPYLGARKANASQEITGQIEFDDYINVTSEEGYVRPIY
ncbi:MAG: M48 family metalloprotease [Candidatus Omnitrophica bacterium]|nr:M48 family metalloprotease [Candidatus Omnitrophota bacterium]